MTALSFSASAVRREIFVVRESDFPKAPSERHIRGIHFQKMSLLRSLGFFYFGFYKYAAPTALVLRMECRSRPGLNLEMGWARWTAPERGSAVAQIGNLTGSLNRTRH